MVSVFVVPPTIAYYRMHQTNPIMSYLYPQCTRFWTHSRSRVVSVTLALSLQPVVSAVRVCVCVHIPFILCTSHLFDMKWVPQCKAQH